MVGRHLVLAVNALANGGPRCTVPHGDTRGIYAIHASRAPTDVELLSIHHYRVDVVIEAFHAGPVAHRRPCGAIPARNPPRCDRACQRKFPTDVDVVAVHRQIVDAAVDASAHRLPRAAIPTRDVFRGKVVQRLKVTGDIEIYRTRS